MHLQAVSSICLCSVQDKTCGVGTNAEITALEHFSCDSYSRTFNAAS
jgi:hypothetical protein